MTRPSVKATKALEKPSAVKPLHSKWTSADDEPKATLNASFSRVFELNFTIVKSNLMEMIIICMHSLLNNYGIFKLIH